MQLIIYIFLYPILWCISLLPFRLLYILSDVFYILTYYIIGYRKKTVRENLTLTLPHLSDKERFEIEKKSYKNMCDVFLEMIKTLTISKSEMEKRYKFKNIEVYDYLEKKGKKIFNEIFDLQKKRIYNALLNSSSEEVINFDNVLSKIING